VLAALIILLLTFGSLAAAGMPLITAGLGLITGVALIGLATHVTNLSNISPELALMIGLGVGIDYSLFIVTRFRENYLEFGDVEQSVVEAMDTSGRAILLAGATVVTTPVTSLYSGSTSHLASLVALDQLDALTGVGSKSLISEKQVMDRVAEKGVVEYAAAGTIDAALGAGVTGRPRQTRRAGRTPRGRFASCESAR